MSVKPSDDGPKPAFRLRWNSQQCTTLDMSRVIVSVVFLVSLAGCAPLPVVKSMAGRESTTSGPPALLSLEDLQARLPSKPKSADTPDAVTQRAEALQRRADALRARIE